MAGAGGIEPRNNPLLYKDFSIPARPFDSIFDSKAKALVGMTDGPDNRDQFSGLHRGQGLDRVSRRPAPWRRRYRSKRR